MIEKQRTYKLGELCQYVNRGISPKYSDKGITVINQRCIRNGVIDLTLCKYHNQEYKLTSEKVLQRGDILINSTGVGTAGRVGLFLADAIVTADSHVTILRLNSKIAVPKFVFYSLRLREKELESIAEGSTGQIELGRQNIKQLEVSLPSLQLQNRIADIIAELDEKLELNRQMNQTLEEMAQVMFKHYFEVGVDSENLPEGWTIGKFEEYFDVIKGLSYKGSGLCGIGEGIPMYNLNSVYEGGGYKVEGIKYYKGEYKDRHLLNPWDIIVTNTEQGHKLLLIGYPAVVPSYISSPGIFTHHIYKLGIKNNIITPQYLYYLLLQPYVREQIISCTNGTTVNMLFADGLKIPEFIVPPRELVIKFSEFVVDLWKMKEANHVESETLKNTFDTLLPKLISGEVIPVELNQLESAL